MREGKQYRFFGVELIFYSDCGVWVTHDGLKMSDCWVEFDKLAYKQLTFNKQQIFLQEVGNLINENNQ